MKPVAIVMPVHNRPEHTEQSIVSLYDNTNTSLFRLYVVDDGSDEPTKELLKNLSKKYSFLLTRHNEAIAPGPSRNEICLQIEDIYHDNDFLYHSDNDVYFTPGWLPVAIDTYRVGLETYNCKVLGAGCHPYLQSATRTDAIMEVKGQIYRIGFKDAVSGYSQLMNWGTWRKYGPFDETMRGAEKKIMGSEDWAFCQKIIRDGYRVGSIEPDLVIATGKTNTYGEPATGIETFKDHYGVKVL